MTGICRFLQYNDKVYNKGVALLLRQSAWIYDFKCMDLEWDTGARAFLNVDNLFDNQYIASSHNYGVRPNKPQTVMAGLAVDKLNKFYIVLR